MILPLVEFLFLSLVVIGAAYGSVRFLGRRLMPAGARLRIVETVPLGPGRALILLRAGGRMLLVGSTAHSIGLVAELDDIDEPSEPDGLSPRPERRQRLGEPPTFRELLDRLRGMTDR